MAGRQRVLIYRLGSLGDTVVALPALHVVARAFPDAERRLLTNFPVAEKAPPAAAILENTGLVDGYFRYYTGTRSWYELLRLWSDIRLWRPDVLVYLGPARGVESARRDVRFFRLCGIRRIVGAPLTPEMQRNRVAFDSALGFETEEYEAARLLRNIAELGPASLDDAASWELHLTPGEHARAADALAAAAGRPVIAVSLGTKVQANDWQPENWRELVKRLAALCPGYALVLTGAASDREVSDEIAKAWDEQRTLRDIGPALNLCGQLTPRESAAVFAAAKVFIGHDSGPMHLAAATGTPCVAIFSARGWPRRWFPYGAENRVLYHRVSCAGCGLETCVVERKRCILSIRVDEVLDQLLRLLNHPQVSFPATPAAE